MPDWLGLGRLKSTQFGTPTDEDLRFAEFSGVLRGVQKISFGKLARARTMYVHVVEGNAPGEPNFLVIPQDKDEADGYNRVRRRGEQWTDYYPNDGDGEWVNLFDPACQRCHCLDFLNRGEREKSPCAHILAALIHIQHPTILPFLAELEARDRIAAAAQPEEGSAA